VDAQAPGLAQRVRGLAEGPHGGGDWHSRVVERIALLHLLRAALQRRHHLEPGLRADVEAQVGFSRSKEELLRGRGVGRRATELTGGLHGRPRASGRNGTSA